MTGPDKDSFGPAIRQGGWVLRLAEPAEMPAVLALRQRSFRRAPGVSDSDSFDTGALHLFLGREDMAAPLATLRLRLHRDRASLLGGYAAQAYDLSGLAGQGGVALELGRLCTEPGSAEGDPLRLIWAGVARLALRAGAARLIGCTSFHTTDPGPLTPALALLAARHLGPDGLRPGIKADETWPLPSPTAADPAAAALLPPLLRAYLAMGGWVSDHLVIDRDLGTCHVFTCVEIDRMPEARRRILEKMAAG